MNDRCGVEAHPFHVADHTLPSRGGELLQVCLVGRQDYKLICHCRATSARDLPLLKMSSWRRIRRNWRISLGFWLSSQSSNSSLVSADSQIVVGISNTPLTCGLPTWSSVCEAVYSALPLGSKNEKRWIDQCLNRRSHRCDYRPAFVPLISICPVAAG